MPTSGIASYRHITPFVQAQWEGDKIVSLKFTKIKDGYLGTLAGVGSGEPPVLLIEQVESTVPGPPSPPTGMKTASKKGHILLDWADNPDADVVFYNVYRSPTNPGNEGFGRPIATGLVFSEFADVTFSENRANCDLPDDVIFTYYVTAVDAHGYESAPGQEFTGTALPLGE